MMLERFTPDARAIVTQAVEHARRLGHRYVGGEHILLAAVSTGQPASSVLCAHGITPEWVEGEIRRRAGLGAGAGLFGGLDRDALASIGIDIDAVRARIEASFGPQALTSAAQAVYRDSLRPRHRFSPLRRRRRAVTPPPVRATDAAGRYSPSGQIPGRHVPFTPIAKKILELSLREALACHDSHVGVEHIALALLAFKRGLVPLILASADTPVPELRAAILDRYRQAS
jgi:hypothetical protein